MSLAFSECKKCKLNKIGYICSWEDKFNYNCKNFTPKEKKKIAEEMLEPVDDLLEYALEKLGMTKEELEDEMNEDKKDIKFIEKCIKDNEKRKEYCKKFDSDCNGCEVRRFKDKYEKYGYIPCDDVYKYLKEKGEI